MKLGDLPKVHLGDLPKLARLLPGKAASMCANLGNLPKVEKIRNRKHDTGFLEQGGKSRNAF